MHSKYFFTKEACSCPLNSLSPDEIKKSYSKELSKYDIRRMRYYNLVSKALGFQDWTVYQKEYTDNILPFLEKNGLKKYAPTYKIEIFKAQHDIYFSYRKISDRIFLSEKPIPKKIFTGYDCKIDNYLAYRGQFPSKGNPLFGDKLMYDKLLVDEDYLKLFIQSDDYIDILEEQELDYLIPTSLGDFFSLMNLVGDTFVIDENKKKEHLSMTYEGNIGLVNQDRFQGIGDIIHKQLKELNKGWIEVIPFNKNLIFLKANDGTYDFVFKGLRDEPFRSKYGKYIRTKNIPSLLNEDYDFDRWKYFGFKDKNKKPKDIKPYDIWLERDSHLSEIEYYKDNTLQNYPGVDKILKDYYLKTGAFSYYRKPSNKILEGFTSFKLEDKTLYVSDLISIKEFLEFYHTKDKDNQSYQESRLNTLENLPPVNSEEDENVPVSVTWYDAIAYCRYIENKYNVHTRLLLRDEYEMICPRLVYKKYDHDNKELCKKYRNHKEYDPFAVHTKNELNFFLKDEQLPSPPNFMADFDNVIMKLAKPLEYIENNGLKFCTSTIFKEWTNESNGGYSKVVSARYPCYKERSGYSMFSASLTMKYKYRKVGFRVCYETTKDKK